MEPTSGLSGLSSEKNGLRPKQKEIIEAFKTQTSLVVKLPTGYGKTRAAAGAYAQLQSAGKCNRLLYVVPRAAQAKQAAEDLPDALRLLGIESKSIEVRATSYQAIQAHRNNSLEVYIVTIQALQSSPNTAHAIEAMMQTGKWFVVIDEHHHYGNEGKWSEAIKRLAYCGILAMSATPNRQDGSDHFPTPSITETYYAAAKAGYVKRLSLHAYEYAIDAVTRDERVIKFSTADLIQQVGSDAPEEIDRFMATRKMRWSPKYVSPLVTFPLDRIIDLRMKGVRSQLLIQTMCCSHAQMVHEQIKVLLPEVMSADWVGTGPYGRTEQENDSVLSRFCPRKDPATNSRQWTLDVLVNVGMAGEGLDTMDVTEIIFLTPANITISNLQTIGRGARIMQVTGDRHPICHVNVDTTSPMADYIGSKIMEVFDEGVVIEEEEQQADKTREAADGDYEELPERMDIRIVDCRLIDIRQEPMFKTIRDAMLVDLTGKLSEEDKCRLVDNSAEKILREHLQRGNNQSSVLAMKRQEVQIIPRKLAGLIARRLMSNGIRIEKTTIGDLAKRINSKKKSVFGKVETADEDTLAKMYAWLKKLERSILDEERLDGLPSWLR